MIDWNDPKSMVSKYFSVKEACFLPHYNRLANETDGLDDDAKTALIQFLNNSMDKVRDLIGKPINVHVCYRSPDYNAMINGAKNSAHIARKDPKFGYIAAMDFDIEMGKGSIGANCDEIRRILMTELDRLQLRMEDNGDGSTWCHLDNKPLITGGNRYFRP